MKETRKQIEAQVRNKLAKPNKRKRWNYSPATKCPLFSKKECTGIIIEGQGVPTEEQLETIQNFVEENLG